MYEKVRVVHTLIIIFIHNTIDMTKSELIIKLTAKMPELANKIVRDSVEMFFDEISDAIVSGKRVEIRGFGSFCLHKHSAKMAHDPQTGRKFYVAAKDVPYFRASRILKDNLNDDEYR